MSKTTKIVLACVAGVLLLCCGGGAIVIMGGVKGYQTAGAETTKVGDEIVEAVCSDWDAKELLSRSGPGLKKTPAVEIEGFLKVWKEEYGSYRSGSSQMTGIRSSAATGTGTVVTADYSNDAKFDKGEATVKLVLVRHGSDPWLVESFNVTKK